MKRNQKRLIQMKPECHDESSESYVFEYWRVHTWAVRNGARIEAQN